MESPVWKVLIRDWTTVLMPVVALGTRTMSVGSASAVNRITYQYKVVSFHPVLFFWLVVWKWGGQGTNPHAKITFLHDTWWRSLSLTRLFAEPNTSWQVSSQAWNCDQIGTTTNPQTLPAFLWRTPDGEVTLCPGTWVVDAHSRSAKTTGWQ